MESTRQRILLGGFALAGVGLAVLIGLTNPPSPRELALSAAQSAGLLAEKTTVPEPSSASYGPSDPKVPPKVASVGSADWSVSAPGQNPVEKTPKNVANQPSEPKEPGKTSSDRDCRASGHQGQFFAYSRNTLRGSVLAPVAPAYAEQAGATSAGSSGTGQDRPPDQSEASNSQPNLSSGDGSSPTREAIPQELLQLWKVMHSGRTPEGSSAGLSQEQASPGGVPEAPSGLNTPSTAWSVRSESSVRPGASLSSGPGASAKVPSGGVSLQLLAEPKDSETLSPSPPSRGTEPAASQVQQEGDGRLIINIRNEDIRKVLEMLSEQGNLNILASNSVQGKVSATLTGVDLESALQAILRSTGYVARREGKFIYVGTSEDFLRMEQTADRIGTRVYHPNYVKASDLKDLIQPLLTEKVGLVSVSTPAEIGIATDDDKVGGNNFAGGEAVLVRDYENVLAQIDQVVAEIDVRPMQVHIEAMILSVRLNDSDKFGVDFKKLINNSNFTIGWGTPVDSLSEVTFTQGGLKFGLIDGDIGTFVEALETIGETNVIAAPRLMVLNKHRADILIGRQEGYVNTTQTETATTQSVQFLDIGTQLRIRPFISPDGLIRMEIHPELSDGAVTVQGNFTLPQKDVTKVTTNIMVRDGCTVVIGGLMQEQAISSINQIPFFGNLPLVGVLFRRTTEELKRVEIIVLVTPHIVQEPEAYGEGPLAQCEFERRQDVYLEKMSPLGKRSVARRYLRMAQEAWARQDRNRALRFAEMAVHFDPLNREALDFRALVWQSVSPGPLPEQIVPPGSSRSVTEPLDGPTVAPWILEDLQRPTPATSTPESRLPQVPSPPAEGPEKLPPPDSPGPFPKNTNSPKSEPSSSSTFAPNPVGQDRPRSKAILRPQRFQTELFRPQ